MKRTKRNDRVLAYGEHTGHKHAVTVDVYEREDGLCEFTGPTPLTHEEHGPITIPDGKWVSGQVQEFDHLDNQLRTVQD